MNLSQIKQEAREEFLKKFKCIDANCDQKGCIPIQVAEDEWEAQQCQYCFEVRFVGASFLEETLDRLVDEIEKAVVPEEAPAYPDINFTGSEEEAAMAREAKARISGFNSCRLVSLEAFTRFKGESV